MGLLPKSGTLNQVHWITFILITEEEALTNVIQTVMQKSLHSFIFFPISNKIILEIEDDGIGFNVEVNKTNVNIGLRSMKIRLRKNSFCFRCAVRNMDKPY